MSLIKRISTIIAAGTLGLGLMTGCSTLDKTVAEEIPVIEEIRKGKIEKGKTEEKQDIEKEAKMYKSLAFGVDKNGMFLGWDRDNNDLEDIRGYYDADLSAEGVLTLSLRTIYDGENEEGKGGWAAEKKGYQKFFVRDSKEKSLIVGKDEDGDNFEDRIYLYRLIKEIDRKDMYFTTYNLIEIRQDQNKNHLFEESEAVWKSKEGKLDPEKVI